MHTLGIIILIIYSLCLLFIFGYSLIQLHLTFLYWFGNRKKTTLPQKFQQTWPSVTVQLPLYNELYVVERLLEAVAALDYPVDKLQIQVLDDSTDQTSALIKEKIEQLQNETGIAFSHIQRTLRAGYKAGALQYGLEQATGEFIAIFDADFIPPQHFLKQSITAFEEANIGVVQSRWGHLNTNYSLLTKLQAFGLNAHFITEQQGRSRGNHFLNFNGTAGIWRKACIVNAGGWQSDTLTEDLDLSYRAQLNGWRIVYLEDLVTPAELPASMGALKAQQYRWTKGAVETAKKHLFSVLKGNISFKTKLHASFHLLNSTIYACILLSAILSVPVLFIKMELTELQLFYKFGSLLVFSFIALSVFYWTSLYKTEREGWKLTYQFLPKFILFLSVSMGMSLHNSLAVFEGYVGKKTPFVRTPKYNIQHKGDSWRKRSYFSSGLSFLTAIEGILMLYFSAAIVLAFVIKDYSLLPYHTMLTVGFGIVFTLSLLHSRRV
jgi:cellulose synthase/poly-beta-1,6-N-acetylglucosamine synthase-like glycosyltransferase